jgi:tetratricopeptide (TPR) repeat protein
LKQRVIAGAVLAALLLDAGLASARNPHCAGGIQYVSQAMNDKNRGNTEDYVREINKAVEQLTKCAAQDPADLEAVGYLGWALAEVDSAGPAGKAFQTAITGLTAKGDKKKLDMVATNLESYWARAYNEGIKRIGAAQDAYPDFTKTPTGDEAALKEEAKKQYDAAVVSLTRAKLLKPASAVTIRNLGTAYALMGDFDAAESVLRNGITEAASDTAVNGLKDALRTVRANKAGALVDAKKYDEAIAYYQELVKSEPDNVDHYMGVGSALFSRANTRRDEPRRADFKAAGEAYSKAFAMKPSNGDLGFNAALAFQSSGELALAEQAWRAVLKQTPEDPEALSSLGSTLADMQKYDEAVQVLTKAVNLKPDNKTYFRQLGAVYSKAGNNPKSTEMLMVFMAMNSGKENADPAGAAKAAKAGSPAANTGASMGAPDKVLDWDSEGRKLQTWIFTPKKQAFTFDASGGMSLVQKSDWSTAVAGGKK